MGQFALSSEKLNFKISLYLHFLWTTAPWAWEKTKLFYTTYRMKHCYSWAEKILCGVFFLLSYTGPSRSFQDVFRENWSSLPHIIHPYYFRSSSSQHKGVCFGSPLFEMTPKYLLSLFFLLKIIISSSFFFNLQVVQYRFPHVMLISLKKLSFFTYNYMLKQHDYGPGLLVFRHICGILKMFTEWCYMNGIHEECLFKNIILRC